MCDKLQKHLYGKLLPVSARLAVHQITANRGVERTRAVGANTVCNWPDGPSAVYFFVPVWGKAGQKINLPGRGQADANIHS